MKKLKNFVKNNGMMDEIHVGPMFTMAMMLIITVFMLSFFEILSPKIVGFVGVSTSLAIVLLIYFDIE